MCRGNGEFFTSKISIRFRNGPTWISLQSTSEFREQALIRWNRYIVAFRSKRAEGSVDLDLYTADREAHEEAVTQGGLLAYCS